MDGSRVPIRIWSRKLTDRNFSVYFVAVRKIIKVSSRTSLACTYGQGIRDLFLINIEILSRIVLK